MSWLQRPPPLQFISEDDAPQPAARKNFLIAGIATVSVWTPRPRHSLPPIEDPLMLMHRPKALAFSLYQNFRAAARGLYRIFNPPLYRFYWSGSAPPVAGATAQATNATLDYTTLDTFGDGTWYLSVSYFDGVLDSGFLPIGPQGQTYLTLTISGGAASATSPSAPTGLRLRQTAGGVVQVIARYLAIPDGVNAANAWAIFFTTDGSTPGSGPGNSPQATQGMTGGLTQILSYSLPPAANGTLVKVQLQVSRSGVYSPASEILTLSVSTRGPSAPLAATSWPGELPSQT